MFSPKAKTTTAYALLTLLPGLALLCLLLMAARPPFLGRL
jgi:hypothetical protein